MGYHFLKDVCRCKCINETRKEWLHMKKRTVPLAALALALLFSLAACGSGNGGMSKEELLESAEEVSFSTLASETYDNAVKAKETYCASPIQISGWVQNIEEDHVTLWNGGTSYDVMIDAYLPAEDIAALTTGQKVTVVGINSDTEEKTDSWGGMSFPATHYIMDTAYLVQSRYEISGTLVLALGQVRFDDGTDYIKNIPNINDGSFDGYQNGDQLTISAVISYGDGGDAYSIIEAEPVA